MKYIYFIISIWLLSNCSQHEKKDPDETINKIRTTDTTKVKQVDYTSASVDSLKSLLKLSKNDSNKVNIQLALSNLRDPSFKIKDLPMQYAKVSLALAKQLNYKEGIGRSLIKIAELFYAKQEYQQSLINNINALNIWEEIENKKQIASTMAKIGDCYFSLKETKEGIAYLEKGLLKISETNNKKDEADYLSNAARIYNKSKKYAECINFYTKQIAIQKELNDKKAQAGTFWLIALTYAQEHDDKNAVNYCKQSIKLAEEIKDTGLVIQNYHNLFHYYLILKDYNNTEDCLNKLIVLIKSKGQSTTELYLSYGAINQSQNKTDKAAEYFKKYLNETAASNDNFNIAISYYNLAHTYKSLGESNKALNYFLTALDKSKQLDVNGLQLGIMIRHSLLDLYYSLGKYNKVVEYIKENVKQALENGNKEDLKSCYKLLADVYNKLGDYSNAYKYCELYHSIKDSLSNETKSKDIAVMEKQNEFQKQLKSIELEKQQNLLKQESKQAVAKVELKNQKILSWTVSSGLILIFIFAVRIFKRYKLTNKQKVIIESQKHLVEEKNKEITDSINYAERIQRSFIATKEILNDNLKDYFILFKPKDIVSGDFYWASKLNNGNFALATADSTGHGVPGAILSLLNVTSFESAIKDGFTNPAEILNDTRKTIIERLKKDGSLEGGKDGMDCSLCVYDFKNKKLIIAAAHNHVWIVRGKETIEIKPDKMPVGKHDKDSVSFTQQEVGLQTGDVIYTLTDGFSDQFGGAKGKKFMSKNLRELLTANAHLPMKEQKELLEKTFSDWVGNLEQVDDVTIIGVRI